MHHRVGKKLRYEVCGLALGLLLTGPRSAAAQEAAGQATQHSSHGYPPCDHTPTDADIEGAKGAFQAGNAAYNEADYERAILYWEDAFRRDCTAKQQLLNLARAYESNLQYANAIVALRTYLERTQEQEQTAPIERRIERLEELLQSQAPPPPAPVPEPTPAAKPTSKSEAPPANPEPSEAPKENKTALYVAITGGGVAALSALLYLKQRHDLTGFESKCGKDRQACPDDDTTKDAKKARDGALFFGWTTGIGAAAGVGGLVWYLLDSSSSTGGADTENTAGVHVTPTLLPDFAGVSVDGRFPL